jgi:pSer/pThr/pTyr-binding forkhead associated (FHA) protein
LVNDQRCHEFLLADDDVIDLGGYRLHFQRIGVRRALAGSQPPPISLVVRNGPSIPEPRFDALPPTSILIGHCETALWQLAGAMVSRHHARIEPAGGLWEITDLHSTNGTELNGERITVSSALKHRDQLLLGRFEIQVSLRR